MRRLFGLLCLMVVGCTADVENNKRNNGVTGPSNTMATVAGVDCEDNLCVLTGTITEDYTMTANNAYLLRGGVFIGDDTSENTLTIEPGTIIYGETNSDGMLVVRRNAKIMAEGTAEAPIVMTSSKNEGLRTRGDWGGVIINGNAPINSCGKKGFCEAFGEGGTGFYGGTNLDDSSGVLKYVRIEFAGTLISPDNELNGLALQGVGANTTLDYIQVHMNADDGVEFFGGTADIKHLVVSGVGDDALDWTDGWQGNGQYIVLQQHLDAGDNGIEADNNGENNIAAPMSNPTLSNLTIVGSGGASSDLGIYYEKEPVLLLLILWFMVGGMHQLTLMEMPLGRMLTLVIWLWLALLLIVTPTLRLMMANHSWLKTGFMLRTVMKRVVLL
jgi:hypothetical protein